MKVLFLVPYPVGQAPSQRFRFEQYFETLQDNGVKLKVRSFLDEKTWQSLYVDGKPLAKVFGVLKGFFRRTGDLFLATGFDLIFIHREAAPIGPPIFEWIIAKILRKRIIYDFDDAIWLPNTSVENKLVASWKNHGKVGSICKWSWKVSGGNQFLVNYAGGYSYSAVMNPTTIDTEGRHFPGDHRQNDVITIGWTGTHSTSKYLLNIIPVLRELERDNNFKLLVISNKNPGIELKSMEFRKWNKASEMDDLREMDIGLMPLDDDQWAEGKCGFKALQYLSLQIPALVSPFGVNKNIVDHGINGYHCYTPEDWKSYIIKLMKEVELRNQLGVNGREKVISKYSVISNSSNFLDLFKD